MANPIDDLLTLDARLGPRCADAVHGEVERRLMALNEALRAAHDTAVRRSDLMERIDALNTMRQLDRVAKHLEEAARSVGLACEARLFP